MAAAPRLYAQSASRPDTRRLPCARAQLGRRVLALLAVGALVVAYLTTQVRLAVLQAEARQLRRALADVEASNAILLREVRAECEPALIAKAADAMAMQAPAGADVIHVASTVTMADGGGRQGSPEHLRLLAQRLGTRLGTVFGGPAEASQESTAAGR